METFESACVYVVLGYCVVGWLVLTGIKINYGRMSSSISQVYI